MKGKATNEQLAKVLEYSLTEHQKNLEKSGKEINNFLNEFKNQVEIIKNINLKPDLAEFKNLNERLESSSIEGAKRIRTALNSVYLSPLILGIILCFFVASAGMLVYSFVQIQQANKIAEAKELALKKYFISFLNDNPKAKESYNKWDKRK